MSLSLNVDGAASAPGETDSDTEEPCSSSSIIQRQSLMYQEKLQMSLRRVCAMRV